MDPMWRTYPLTEALPHRPTPRKQLCRKGKGYKKTNKNKNVHRNCSQGVGLSMKTVVLTQLANQTPCSVGKLDMAPHGKPRHNTFMQLSMKAYVMVTQLMSQTLTMHCMLMQCASVSTCSVSTWKSQPSTWKSPHGGPSPPFQPHTDPRLRNDYVAHLAVTDDTKSVGMHDRDMETIPGVPTMASHSPDSYIQSAKQMVVTVSHPRIHPRI